MSLLTVTQLEAAINYWRHTHPASGEEARLCPEAAALAGPYAEMIMAGRRDMPLADLPPTAAQAFKDSGVS